MDIPSIPKEYHPYIREILQKKGIKDVKFNEQKQHFDCSGFLGRWKVADSEIWEAYNLIQRSLLYSNNEEIYNSTYADAVNYFYNNVGVDERGIFRKEGALNRRKYFTQYELDQLVKDYEESTNT